MTSYFSCGAGTPNLKGHFTPLLQWKLGGTASLFLMTSLLNPLPTPSNSSLPQHIPHTAHVPSPQGPFCTDEVSDQFVCWLQQGKGGEKKRNKIQKTQLVSLQEWSFLDDWLGNTIGHATWNMSVLQVFGFSFLVDLKESKTAYLISLMTHSVTAIHWVRKELQQTCDKITNNIIIPIMQSHLLRIDM